MEGGGGVRRGGGGGFPDCGVGVRVGVVYVYSRVYDGVYFIRRLRVNNAVKSLGDGAGYRVILRLCQIGDDSDVPVGARPVVLNGFDKFGRYVFIAEVRAVHQRFHAVRSFVLLPVVNTVGKVLDGFRRFFKKPYILVLGDHLIFKLLGFHRILVGDAFKGVGYDALSVRQRHFLRKEGFAPYKEPLRLGGEIVKQRNPPARI